MSHTRRRTAGISVRTTAIPATWSPIRGSHAGVPNRREPGSVEGFGIAFIEAAAFGTPSIAGADGGTADAVLDGKTGVIVDASDDMVVAAAVRRMLGDVANRRAMGEAAHRRFWNEFAWDSAITRFEDALQIRHR